YGLWLASALLKPVPRIQAISLHCRKAISRLPYHARDDLGASRPHKYSLTAHSVLCSFIKRTSAHPSHTQRTQAAQAALSIRDMTAAVSAEPVQKCTQQTQQETQHSKSGK